MKSVRSLLFAAGCAAALGACGGGSSGPPTTIGPNTIIVSSLAYHPTTLRVHVDDTVTWLFKDGSTPHNVDGASDLNDFSSGSAQTGGGYHYTFKKAGSFNFHCDIHPSMTGTITVN